MEDLKSLTVKYLRELARKHLGKGHSKLKTREELVQALKDFLPASLRPAEKQKTATDAPVRNDVAATKAETKAETKADAKQGAKAESKDQLKPDTKADKATPKSAPDAEEPPQHDAEPLVEGFFVARMFGPDEARRHRMTDEANRHAIESRSKPVYDEKLGELPHTYEDDAAIALPQDPQTVFFFWDFNEQTRSRAFNGLHDPKALLRIFDGETLVREMDFALESKSFYVRGLTPGRRYRLEAHAIGRDGATRRIGRSTNLVAVPSEGPSSDTTVRFLRAPWTLPVGRMMDAIRTGEARVSETHGVRQYLDVEEWEEQGSSESHLKRRVTERVEDVPGRGPADSRRRMLGASERHMGASGWPSGRK